MDDRISRTPLHGWVDAARGLVSREVFVSDDVYRLEVGSIFDRTWMFLAHDSEIPAAGDYVVRKLGSAPVIVVRDADGSIHALLNSCRHRGTKLCRADSGTARHFVCPYHGWSYKRDGRLITTTFDRHFPAGTDFTQMGLVRVPRVDSYKGLVFGSWNPDIVDLALYLGDFRWYLDVFFARSPQGMEVLAPPHRWRVKANWKIGALNFIGDSQHIPTTHVGPLSLDKVRLRQTGVIVPAKNSYQVITDEGHGATLTYLPPGLPEETYRVYSEELLPCYDRTLAPDQRRALDRLRVIVGNVFPNLSFIETQVRPGEKAVILRQWQAVGGGETEVLSWVLAEREASAEYKAHVLDNGVRNFGAAGVFEQDDMELWASATAASDNPIAQRYPYSFETSLPYLDAPAADDHGPGRAFRPVDTEVAQFEFMRHWERVMRANA